MRMAKKPKKRRITGGVDTHSGTHHAAVVLMNGRRLADAEFPATAAGYQALLEWMRSFGRLHAVGVEGTGSYGAALARHLHAEDVRVVEVNRPDRRQRRTKGKSDPLDAYAAADAVLAERATAIPKAGDGIVESIRALHLVRAGAVKSRTACINELQALLVTAPAELRDELAARRRARLRRCRPHQLLPHRPRTRPQRNQHHARNDSQIPSTQNVRRSRTALPATGHAPDRRRHRARTHEPGS
jgi:transposase